MKQELRYYNPTGELIEKLRQAVKSKEQELNRKLLPSEIQNLADELALKFHP